MDTLEQIKSKLDKAVLRWEEKKCGRIYVDIKPEDLPETARFMFWELNLRFIVTTGTDTPEGIELLYHFSDDASGNVISLRTLLADKQNPKIKSLAGIIKGSAWIEREIHELLGVDFIGHPNLAHLLLAEDWPRGSYPLRHDQEKEK